MYVPLVSFLLVERGFTPEGGSDAVLATCLGDLFGRLLLISSTIILPLAARRRETQSLKRRTHVRAEAEVCEIMNVPPTDTNVRVIDENHPNHVTDATEKKPSFISRVIRLPHVFAFLISCSFLTIVAFYLLGSVDKYSAMAPLFTFCLVTLYGVEFGVVMSLVHIFQLIIGVKIILPRRYNNYKHYIYIYITSI